MTAENLIRVVLVDDHFQIHRIVQEILTATEDIRLVGQGANGQEGIELCEHYEPNIVLMDVVMPGMNGFQATRALTKDAETSSIPIIIVTTKDQETDRVWGLRQGAKDYISKPVMAEELISKIRTILGG